MIFDDPPPELTRLRALLESMGGGTFSDTGAAAVLGALADPEFKEIQERSLAVLLNMGNSHAIAFLVHQGRILGVYEQHTGLVNGDRILADLKHFQKGGLESSEVFDAGGHGCLTLDLPDVPRAKVVHVLGPRRDELSGDVRFLHPGGDMMTAGCLGLLHGLKLKLERET